VRDLVIAGGGPVGLATAVYAARAGLDVAVVEPRTGTIDKACGEGLMPGAVTALADLGVRPDGRDLLGIRYVHEPHRAEAAFRHGVGRGVRRTVLHAALRQAASDAAVAILPRAVRRVEQDRHRVLVDDEPGRYLVVADGLHSPVRRYLGLDARPSRRARRYGLRAHVEVSPWTSFVEVYWAPDAEAYVTPVADNLVGIAVLTSRPTQFNEMMVRFPALAARVGRGFDSDRRTHVRGAGPLRQRSRRRVDGRVLLVGDASGYVDALTGEGIALGLAQGRAAVDAVVAGEPRGYGRAWLQLTWRHNLLTAGLLAASRSRMLRSRIVPTAEAVPAVFEAAVNQLARPV
jgi:flavin-dependent dehydrogenase